MKFTTKMILTNVIAIIVAIAITTSFTFFKMQGELERQTMESQERIIKTFWDILKAKGADFSVVNGKFYAGDYLVNSNYELPDKIKELFGGTATIFMGDTRISTNVLKADGSRATNTKLTGLAYDAIFKEGKQYRGKTTILGEPYYTAYDPIKNAKNEIIGVLYVGVKKTDYTELQLMVVVMTVFIAAAICALFYGLFIRKSIVPLVKNLSDMSEKIHFHSGSIAIAMDQQAGFASQLSSSVVQISSTMGFTAFKLCCANIIYYGGIFVYSQPDSAA